MRRVLVDSDILIECLRGNSQVTEYLVSIAAEGSIIYYSPVTEAEIYCGIRKGEERSVQKMFDQLECVNIDSAIGRSAGELLYAFRKSHGIELGDALIAASAIHFDLELFTFNVKHYPMPELKLTTGT